MGWVQVTNFIVSGVLILLFAIGFRHATLLLNGSVWRSRFIGAVGLGLVGDGIFSSDPVFGYPMNVPLATEQFTTRGHLHDLFAVIILLSLVVVCFKFRNMFKENGNKIWATYSLISAISILIAFILAALGFRQIPIFVNIAGVFQRLCIIIGFTWMTLLAFYIIKTHRTV